MLAEPPRLGHSRANPIAVVLVLLRQLIRPIEEEGTMPDPSSPEATAIEVAYEDQVKALFKVLVANLVEEPVSHEADRQCVDKFAAGLKLAKRARELALNVVVPASPAKKIAPSRKKK
jgi:hypothetical protein